MKAYKWILLFLRYPFHRVIISSDKNGFINQNETNWTEDVEFVINKKAKTIIIYFEGM
jgi:hypothetical protein